MAPSVEIDFTATCIRLYNAGWHCREISRLLEAPYLTVKRAVRGAAFINKRWFHQSYGVRYANRSLNDLERRIQTLIDAGITEVEWRGRIGGTQRLSDDQYRLITYLYCERNLSTQQIADLLGVTRNTVAGRLRRGGIPRRDLSEAQILRHRKTTPEHRRKVSLKGCANRGDFVPTPEFQQHVVDLYLEGRSMPGVANVLRAEGMEGSQTALTKRVYTALKKAGVTQHTQAQLAMRKTA